MIFRLRSLYRMTTTSQDSTAVSMYWFFWVVYCWSTHLFVGFSHTYSEVICVGAVCKMHLFFFFFSFLFSENGCVRLNARHRLALAKNVMMRMVLYLIDLWFGFITLPVILYLGLIRGDLWICETPAIYGSFFFYGWPVSKNCIYIYLYDFVSGHKTSVVIKHWQPVTAG